MNPDRTLGVYGEGLGNRKTKRRAKLIVIVVYGLAVGDGQAKGLALLASYAIVTSNLIAVNVVKQSLCVAVQSDG